MHRRDSLRPTSREPFPTRVAWAKELRSGIESSLRRLAPMVVDLPQLRR